MRTACTGRGKRSSKKVLGHYASGQGTRTLYARRNGDATYLTDGPANGRGVVYAVETIPQGDGPGAVTALARLYLQEARELGASPMGYTALDPDLRAAA